jgi:hypothetical protein
MKIYFLSWVQLSYGSGKVVLGGTTQGYFHPIFLIFSLIPNNSRSYVSNFIFLKL